MDISRRICVSTISIVPLPFIISECTAGCWDDARRDCGCTGPACITEMGQVIGLICGILAFGAILIALILYCVFTECGKTARCCLCCRTENREHEHVWLSNWSRMGRSQWEREDLKITSFRDGPDVSKYTLTWEVRVDELDIPVTTFILEYKQVEVMPDRVDGQYRIRRHLEPRYIEILGLSVDTRNYTFTHLQPESYYEVKLIRVYNNYRRKTTSFIFKTSAADRPDTEELFTPTHTTLEEPTDLSMQNTLRCHVTDYNGKHVITDHVTDFRNSCSRGQSCSDQPPSYEKVVKTSKKIETLL